MDACGLLLEGSHGEVGDRRRESGAGGSSPCFVSARRRGAGLHPSRWDKRGAVAQVDAVGVRHLATSERRGGGGAVAVAAQHRQGVQRRRALPHLLSGHSRDESSDAAVILQTVSQQVSLRVSVQVVHQLQQEHVPSVPDTLGRHLQGLVFMKKTTVEEEKK